MMNKSTNQDINKKNIDNGQNKLLILSLGSIFFVGVALLGTDCSQTKKQADRGENQQVDSVKIDSNNFNTYKLDTFLFDSVYTFTFQSKKYGIRRSLHLTCPLPDVDSAVLSTIEKSIIEDCLRYCERKEKEEIKSYNKRDSNNQKIYSTVPEATFKSVAEWLNRSTDRLINNMKANPFAYSEIITHFDSVYMCYMLLDTFFINWMDVLSYLYNFCWNLNAKMIYNDGNILQYVIYDDSYYEGVREAYNYDYSLFNLHTGKKHKKMDIFISNSLKNAVGFVDHGWRGEEIDWIDRLKVGQFYLDSCGIGIENLNRAEDKYIYFSYALVLPYLKKGTDIYKLAKQKIDPELWTKLTGKKDDVIFLNPARYGAWNVCDFARGDYECVLSYRIHEKGIITEEQEYGVFLMDMCPDPYVTPPIALGPSFFRDYSYLQLITADGGLVPQLVKGTPIYKFVKEQAKPDFLLLTCAGGKILGAQALLNDGIDVNYCGADGVTALMYAAWSGNFAIVEMLLSAGADANRVDKEGRTALMYAIAGSFYDWNYDWSYNRYHDSYDSHVWSGKCTSYWCNDVSTIIKLLLKNGANPMHKDKEGRTAIMYAIGQVKKECDSREDGKILPF
ncbi:MAG: ankyrin repeat domain-containing protein [Bacteroidales bacterium]|jgi:hypothetical protein|nr:ankyrin repeat domain-containing protein [Bacteroidales bacterium]